MSIDFIRTACSKFSLTTEDVKWENNLCFSVVKKLYCITDLEGPFKASFKCDEEDFVSLTERDNIIPAPYLAKNKWVSVQKSSALSKKEWEFFLRKSYELIASKLPKKTREQLDFTILNLK